MVFNCKSLDLRNIFWALCCNAQCLMVVVVVHVAQPEFLDVFFWMYYNVMNVFNMVAIVRAFQFVN